MDAILIDACIVCHENGATKQLTCGHKFHLECLRSWRAYSDVCPGCRNIRQHPKSKYSFANMQNINILDKDNSNSFWEKQKRKINYYLCCLNK